MLRGSNEVRKRVTGPKKRVQLRNPKGKGMGCGKVGRYCDELASDVADDEGHARDAGVESNAQRSEWPAAEGGRRTRFEVEGELGGRLRENRRA